MTHSLNWGEVYESFCEFSTLMVSDLSEANMKGELNLDNLKIARKLNCAIMEGNFQEAAQLSFLLWKNKAHNYICREAALKHEEPQQQELNL